MLLLDGEVADRGEGRLLRTGIPDGTPLSAMTAKFEVLILSLEEYMAELKKLHV